MIVLDASVLIALLDTRDAHHAAAMALLRGTAGDDLGANTVTLAEALVGPARRGRLDEVLEVVADLGIDELTLPVDAVAGLAELRASTGLRMPDCLVLMSAAVEGATVATFDDRMRRASLDRRLAVTSRLDAREQPTVKR